MTLDRGTVVLVELDPTVGREQQGVRPCVAVSDPSVNAAQRFPLIAVVPVTGTAGVGALYPALSPGTSGLTKTSVHAHRPSPIDRQASHPSRVWTAVVERAGWNRPRARAVSGPCAEPPREFADATSRRVVWARGSARKSSLISVARLRSECSSESAPRRSAKRETRACRAVARSAKASRDQRRLNVAVYIVPDAYVHPGTRNSENVPSVRLSIR